MNASGFSKRLKAYCKYCGYHLNIKRPNKEGDDFNDFLKDNPGRSFIGGPDKSNGHEYITISDHTGI